jgi:ribosome biogenesis GTPase
LVPGVTVAGVTAGLDHLGWDDEWEGRWRASGASGPPVRVARVDRGWSTVWGAGGTTARLRNLGAGVAVGDWVVASDDGERVALVLDRRSAFVRRTAQGTAADVVAANVHVAWLLHPLGRRLNARRLERELVLAFESGAAPVVVLTKADLADASRDARGAAPAVAAGCPVHVVSALASSGLDGLRADAAVGRTVALISASGAGKSTLVNALVGADVQRVGATRADRKGRHTTTAAELIALPGGGWLVDTPGLRALGLWSEGDGLARAFSDVVALAADCRFDDCRHGGEPGCAVTDAVDDGLLPVERLDSYRRLRDEEEALVAELSRR